MVRLRAIRRRTNSRASAHPAMPPRPSSDDPAAREQRPTARATTQGRSPYRSRHSARPRVTPRSDRCGRECAVSLRLQPCASTCEQRRSKNAAKFRSSCCDYRMPMTLWVCTLSRHCGFFKHHSIANCVFSKREGPSIGCTNRCSKSSVFR